jgi:hypothetical protein
VAIVGIIAFDYSNQNGVRAIGSGDSLFETRWSRAGGDSIHIYDDAPSIKGVSIALGANSITEIRDAERFNFSSGSRDPRVGEVVILRNANDKYAALKLLEVKAVGHNSNVDEVRFEYAILPDGSRDFANAMAFDVGGRSFAKRVLLLGAGFSKNWGGLLASDVWEHIFSDARVQARPRLVALLQHERSFEDALEKARTGLYEREDQAAIEAAIQDAFERMDVRYRNPDHPVLTSTANDFISRFCPGPTNTSTGFVFSLNQDLLLERIYGVHVDRHELLPVSRTPSLGVMMEPEVDDGTETIQPRVQARGG